MQRFLGCTLVWFVTAALSSGSCFADDAGISARHHGWGRFQPGAWKLVRIVTETFDDHGAPTGTNLTETKTTLQSTDSSGVTLEMEVGMEVAGKQFDAQPQSIKQGFHGELLNPEPKLSPSRAGQVTIEGHNLPCRIQQLEIPAGDSQTQVTIYYSDTTAPYVLKRESVTTDAGGKNILGQTTLDVMAIDLPWKIRDDIKSVACIKTVQRHAKGTVTSLAMTSAAVPGGIVFQTSKETDPGGRLTRRSVLELVNYGLHAEDEAQRPVRSQAAAAPQVEFPCGGVVRAIGFSWMAVR